MKTVKTVLFVLAMLAAYIGIEFGYAQFNQLEANEIKGYCQRSDWSTFEFSGKIDLANHEIILDAPLPENSTAACNILAETIIPWDVQTFLKNDTLSIAFTPFTFVSR